MADSLASRLRRPGGGPCPLYNRNTLPTVRMPPACEGRERGRWGLRDLARAGWRTSTGFQGSIGSLPRGSTGSLMKNCPPSLPNVLTLLRILLVPVFVDVDFLASHGGAALLASTIFVWAAVTDELDGALARTWGSTSRFGQVIDARLKGSPEFASGAGWRPRATFRSMFL